MPHGLARVFLKPRHNLALKVPPQRWGGSFAVKKSFRSGSQLRASPNSTGLKKLSEPSMYGNAPFSCYISHQPKVAKTERATFLFGAYSLVYTGRVMFHDFKPYIVDKLVTLDCIDSDPAGATDSMEIY